MTSSSAPSNNNFISFTSTMKLTNSIGLAAGYTLLFTFCTLVAGTYSFLGQMAYQWGVGQAQWNLLVYRISLSIYSYDSECYSGIFERKPRVSGTGREL